MYKSPIEKIYGEFETQMVREEEKMVIKAVRNVGINVDKAELISALRYDRNQYTKGYEDSKNEVLDKIRAKITELDNKVCQQFLIEDAYKDVHHAYQDCLKIIDECKAEIEAQTVKPKVEKCKWIKYDYRTICPKNHDIDNSYWRILENTECLKYCPYCGKEIEVVK